MSNNILEIIDWLAYRFHFDYLEAYITDKGNLIFYDRDEKHALRNSKNELLHNKKAIDWLVNEAIIDIDYRDKKQLYMLVEQLGYLQEGKK